MELALVICLVVIIWVVLAKLGKKEKEQERKEQAEQIAHRKNLLHFYQMCKKAGIAAIQTKKIYKMPHRLPARCNLVI